MLRGVHRPILIRDDKHDSFGPHLILYSGSQRARYRRGSSVGVALVHCMRQHALARRPGDFAVPVIFLHICVQIVVILLAWISAQFNSDERGGVFFGMPLRWCLNAHRRSRWEQLGSVGTITRTPMYWPLPQQPGGLLTLAPLFSTKHASSTPNTANTTTVLGTRYSGSR